MSAFFGFMAAQRDGILLALLVLSVLVFLLNALLWMFRGGRYRGSSPQTDTKLRLIMAEFFAKLIDDFRHLLALVVVMLFAVTLFSAMLPGLQSGKLNDLKDGIQAVAAALGGLIGSIIGYYFGESAGSRMRQPSGSNDARNTNSQVATPDSRDATLPPLPDKPTIQSK